MLDNELVVLNNKIKFLENRCSLLEQDVETFKRENAALKEALRVSLAINSSMITFDYKFWVPYVRLTSTEAVCYAVGGLRVWANNKGEHFYYPRFIDLFKVNLYRSNFGVFENGSYKLRSFNTCMEYDKFKAKMERRIRINYKGLKDDWTKILSSFEDCVKNNKNYCHWFSEYTKEVNDVR